MPYKDISMNISLKAISLHQLIKNESHDLELKHGGHFLPIPPAYEALAEAIYRTYMSKAKGYGLFATDSQFKQRVIETRSGHINFHDFSISVSIRLQQELCKYPFADEGTIVIAELQSLATDYLLVALIGSNLGISVKDNLSLSPTDYLDIPKMDLVAVINLSTFETDPSSNRYISFIKGRIGRKVSDFFIDFMQAETSFDPKQQNQVLIQAVEDFCVDNHLEREELISLKRQVSEYCLGQKKSGDEIIIEELSEEIPPQNGISFSTYTETNGYDLEKSFPVDSGSIRKLTKYTGAGGGLNVTFDALLLGERVFYDPETDTLTIKGTPPNLRDQLQRQGGAK